MARALRLWLLATALTAAVGGRVRVPVDSKKAGFSVIIKFWKDNTKCSGNPTSTMSEFAPDDYRCLSASDAIGTSPADVYTSSGVVTIYPALSFPGQNAKPISVQNGVCATASDGE